MSYYNYGQEGAHTAPAAGMVMLDRLAVPEQAHRAPEADPWKDQIIGLLQMPKVESVALPGAGMTTIPTGPAPSQGQPPTALSHFKKVCMQMGGQFDPSGTPSCKLPDGRVVGLVGGKPTYLSTGVVTPTQPTAQPATAIPLAVGAGLLALMFLR